MNLPDDCLVEIFKWLDVFDILNINVICKRFYGIVHSGDLWRNFTYNLGLSSKYDYACLITKAHEYRLSKAVNASHPRILTRFLFNYHGRVDMKTLVKSILKLPLSAADHYTYLTDIIHNRNEYDTLASCSICIDEQMRHVIKLIIVTLIQIALDTFMANYCDFGLDDAYHCNLVLWFIQLLENTPTKRCNHCIYQIPQYNGICENLSNRRHLYRYLGWYNGWDKLKRNIVFYAYIIYKFHCSSTNLFDLDYVKQCRSKNVNLDVHQSYALIRSLYQDKFEHKQIVGITYSDLDERIFQYAIHDFGLSDLVATQHYLVYIGFDDNGGDSNYVYDSIVRNRYARQWYTMRGFREEEYQEIDTTNYIKVDHVHHVDDPIHLGEDNTLLNEYVNTLEYTDIEQQVMLHNLCSDYKFIDWE